MYRSPSSSTFLTAFLLSAIVALSLVVVSAAWLSGRIALGQSTNPFLSSVAGYPNWSAFTGLRWEGDKPIVRFEDQWYELVSFHGIPVEEILKHCDEKGWPKQRRFSEDLVQIVRLMGHKIDKTTNLVLRDESGKVVTKNNVAMTEANQSQLTGAPVGASSNPFSSSAPGYPVWSAFTGVRWEGDKPIVRFEEQWYELVSFHGIPVEQILKHCDEKGWPKQVRFSEDLVQIVRLMGHQIDKTTNLVLRDESGNVVTKNDVVMTEANLRTITGETVTRSAMPATLTREEVLADLAEFQTNLESQFSYLRANNVDYVAAIQAIGQKEGDQMETFKFAAELRKVIALFIDGHAGVSPSGAGYVPGYLPFRIEASGDRFVAVRPDRSGFLDDQLPYIRAIDGVELSRWLAAAAVDVPKGSPQLVRGRGLQLISLVQHFRGELGLEIKDTIQVELASRDGETRRTSSWPVANRPALGGDWPPLRPPGILAGNIGYLRLESMNDRAVQLLREWMPKFRETDGLIIDVRGNGGGIRTPILELAGYLLTKEDPPRIGNVAKYRLAPQFNVDQLSAARYVYQEDSDRLGDRERAAVGQFKQTFKPEWEPPADQFSPWHYLVLSKRPDDPRFDYRQPVAILMDEGCFSATDIFLGAFKGWPNVSLVGQPSGGGSAHSQGFRLSRSGLSVRCASMASFQPNGKLYDTNGVEPDVLVERPPEYYVQGGKDVILDKALELVITKKASKEL
jgi:hypothetical protein